MHSFIQDVLLNLQKKYNNLSHLTFVLPSKRAGLFLFNHLSKELNNPVFAPTIFSIEEFVEELSSIKKVSNSELLFELYNVYLKTPEFENKDTFEAFSKWAQILLQDVNEIDRYLLDSDAIFDYLYAIKQTNHWSLEQNQTQLIKDYLKFWNSLKPLYYNFKENLLKKGKGYQGLIYREAVNNLEDYIQESKEVKLIFAGFNALNTAESTIIQELLHSDLAEVFWDIDSHFVDNTFHDAGLFMRQNNKWRFFESNPIHWLHDNYKQEKHIEVVGLPKNVNQAKYVGELLKKLQNNSSLDSTALVLGNEELIFPILNSIPKEVDTLNITMGIPLKSIPITSLFDKLFQIQIKNKTSFYYKDVVEILSQPIIQKVVSTSEIINHINKNNLVYISLDKLVDLSNNSELIKLLFNPWNDNIQKALNCISDIIYALKNSLDIDKETHKLDLEYLFRFLSLFNSISLLESEYSHLKASKDLQSIYKELLNLDTLDFKGEPLKGLQIMGVLESRVLDFETVIITGVNEGILPSGKSQNSFIPFDVKKENNLPTYKEKDAIYTYHFYHLLQRAKNVYIVYNTEPDVLNGGEKSRFITQLEVEGIHKINHKIVAPKTPKIDKTLRSIKKTKGVQEKIIELAAKGFSPSSLTSYIRNPLDFYYQKILGIKEEDAIEETVAANTLGNVIHKTLEELYTPFLNVVLSAEIISQMKAKVENIVFKYFQEEYKLGDITKGKNLIIFEVSKQYVLNFLEVETKSITSGNEIIVRELELENEIEIDIPELSFPIKLKGTVDRIDEFNGTLRIIDYKTGKVEGKHVSVFEWDELLSDYKKYSKSFQVLTYAYFLHKQNKLKQPSEAGIISFKNLNSGFIKFGVKASVSARKKDSEITTEVLDEFTVQLKKLILEICNPDIDFTEKELDENHNK